MCKNKETPGVNCSGVACKVDGRCVSGAPTLKEFMDSQKVAKSQQPRLIGATGIEFVRQQREGVLREMLTEVRQDLELAEAEQAERPDDVYKHGEALVAIETLLEYITQ